ncbi:hypothetical protein DL98DRAFT_464128 [Cadophora sp. DSE1049]|nr:hypothetical protein DL98DRAFT_464128 [Cadophora sp. DSE1049]
MKSKTVQAFSGSRRTHTKSRHGCAQCKSSHVKCDLVHPRCGKCVKTRKICQFQQQDELSSGAATPSNKSPPKHDTSTSELTDKFQADAISWDDMELLHHFLTDTANTLADRADLQQMWKIMIPKLAMKQRFLMHLIFSVAALHMADSNVERRSSYVDRALQHHNIALPYFRSQWSSATQENATSLFIGATLIFAFSLNLAVSRPPAESRTWAVREILGIFVLLRGIPLVFGDTWERAARSDIAPLFTGRVPDESVCLPGDVAEALDKLKKSDQLLSETFDSETYLLAIERLESSFKVPVTEGQDFGLVFEWPIHLRKEYIGLLSSRRSVALVILAHYAVILHELRNRWWVSGWGVKLVREIYLMLDDNCKSLMEWPLRKILPSETIPLNP